MRERPARYAGLAVADDAAEVGDNRCVVAVEVSLYDPEWADAFAREQVTLRHGLDDVLISVEHIGSTAVRGLAAKPTIDILAVVATESLAPEALVEPLAQRGYEYRPGSFPDEPEHLFFRRVVGGRRTHHLHVLPADSPAVQDYLMFRDFLRTHPLVTQAYGAYKLRLAESSDTRGEYVEAKQRYVDGMMAVIRGVITRAR